jgi:hypothetical protein
MQVSLYPEMERIQMLREKKPKLAAEETAVFQQREWRLLRLNLACAVIVLLCTALATAV